jgi:predicted nucleic acid-binding protein
MTYLADANVVCEPTKLNPAPSVIDWLRSHDADIVMDPIVLGEIWHGIDALPLGRKRTRLTEWFQELRETLVCLDWTDEVAVVWGGTLNTVRRSGRTVGVRDTMIAATALHYGLTVATRNVADFSACGVPVVNPFDG